jgi:hypothetical protein
VEDQMDFYLNIITKVCKKLSTPSPDYGTIMKKICIN